MTEVEDVKEGGVQVGEINMCRVLKTRNIPPHVSLSISVYDPTNNLRPNHTHSNKTDWEWMGKQTGHDCGLCHAVLFASVKHQSAS